MNILFDISKERRSLLKIKLETAVFYRRARSGRGRLRRSAGTASQMLRAPWRVRPAAASWDVGV